MIRLSGADRINIAKSIKADIDAFSLEKYKQTPRTHLGGSEIGEVCSRRLVYSFRWMSQENHIARMLRLFQRGHKEENVFVELLRGIGCSVSDQQENGQQHRITTDNKHFGGSLDGVISLPERYNLPFPMLLEMKTHNDKSFKKLVADGMRVTKPKHFAQCCTYGYFYSFRYCLYMAVNKNDDDLWPEIVELDLPYGHMLADRAKTIINADRLPERISNSSAHKECKYCPMQGICHFQLEANRNCRSCCHSAAQADGSWFCKLPQNNQTIPTDVIPKGCNQWQQFK